MKFINLNSGFDYKLLSTINGVKFTNRQIDVAACLIGRQKYKEIGRVLSISSSTVDEHLKKIKAAIRSSSVSNPTGLLEFFERSDLYKNLKLHYVKLFTQYYFEEILAKMAKEVNIEEKSVIQYHANIRKHNFINKKIRAHLILAGIDINIDSIKEVNHAPARTPEQKIIYIIPNNIKEELEKDCDKSNSMIYITQEPEKPEKKAVEQQNKTSGSYYEGFFELLNVICKDFNIESYAKKFYEKKTTLENNSISDGLSSKTNLLKKGLKHDTLLTQRATTEHPSNVSVKRNVKSKVIYGTILLIAAIILALGIRKNTVEVITAPKDDSIAFNLPRPLDYYIPRVDVTKAIWNILTKGNKKTAILAGLHGLGGIGKTTLALNVIHNPNQSYEFRGWFRAETKELLKSDYLELGEELHLFSEEISDDKKIKEVTKWLNNKKNILLVYDNAPDLETLNDYLPNNGHIIITSRNYKLPGAIEVDVMTELEALNLLNKLIPNKIKDAENYNKDSRTLIKKLGYLPLAISQAGAYISSHVITLTNYLKLYETEKHHLLSEKMLPSGDRHEPVYVTWNVNIKHIQQHAHGEDVLKLLDFISICHPDNISRTLLTQYLYGETDSKTTMLFNQVLNILRQHSLIKTAPDFISIHHLVHDWVKYNRDKTKTVSTLKEGIKAIERIYPWRNKITQEIEFVKHLIPHTESILSQAQPFFTDVDLLNFMSIMGDAYLFSGNYIKSQKVFEDVLIVAEKHFGSDHIMTSKALHYLGWASLYLGDSIKAKELLERALDIKEKHYGANHFQLEYTLRQLGETYIALGDHAKAKQLLEKALAIGEKNYGSNHVEVSYTLRQLGKSYRVAGNYIKAKHLLESVLAIEKKNYGSNHIETSSTFQQLAWVYVNTGEYIKAKESSEQTLAIKEKHYGSDHLSISYIADQRSWLNLCSDDYAKAKQWAEKDLAIKGKYYDSSHVEMSHPLQQLGWVALYLGDYIKARNLLERALELREKYYGKTHVNVSYILQQLGWVYLHLGNYVKARQSLETALAIDGKDYGYDNIEVSFLLNALGVNHYHLYDYTKSKELIEKAASMLNKLHGQNHIFTAITLANLGNVNRMLGNIDESKKLLEQSLSFLQKLNGKDNMHTAKIMGNLGLLYGDMGDNTRKREFLEKTLKVFKQHLPSEHIDIKRTEKELKKSKGDLVKRHDKKERELGYLIIVPA